jgi:hypothetical protein
LIAIAPTHAAPAQCLPPGAERERAEDEAIIQASLCLRRRSERPERVPADERSRERLSRPEKRRQRREDEHRQARPAL